MRVMRHPVRTYSDEGFMHGILKLKMKRCYKTLLVNGKRIYMDVFDKIRTLFCVPIDSELYCKMLTNSHGGHRCAVVAVAATS